MRAAQFLPSLLLLRRLVVTGLSPFGLSLSASILILFNNWQCLRWGGQSAVATYAILSYLLGSLQPLLTGIGEGMQPLCSYCRGAGDEAGLHRLLVRGLRLILLFSTALCASSVFCGGRSPRCSALRPPRPPGLNSPLCVQRCPCLCGAWSACFPLIFTPLTRRGAALSLYFWRPAGGQPLCLYVLPLFAQLNGVWLAAPAAQSILVLLLGWMLWRNRTFAN